jgi:hypothetical protein
MEGIYEVSLRGGRVKSLDKESINMQKNNSSKYWEDF